MLLENAHLQTKSMWHGSIGDKSRQWGLVQIRLRVNNLTNFANSK